jgi:hypothetical protein
MERLAFYGNYGAAEDAAFTILLWDVISWQMSIRKRGLLP